MVLHIARCKHARYAGLRGKALAATLRHDVAAVQLQLALEDIGIGCVANGDKAALHGHIFRSAAFCCLDAHGIDALVIAQHFVERGVQLENDLAFLDLVHELVNHDGLGLEAVAAMNQVHLAGDVAEVERLFHRRVAAPYHAHILPFVEKAVTRGKSKEEKSSTKKQTKVEALLQSTTKTKFLDALTAIAKDGVAEVTLIAQEVHFMSVNDYTYFSTLLRFQYASLNNIKK